MAISEATSELARQVMVDRQIVARGVHDARLLDALRSVPREAFVPEHLAEFAHDDVPLPIAAGQTISQPYVVALMIEALQLEPADRVLEVGSGSGYAAAVLSRLSATVFAIERHRELVDSSRAALERLGYDNVTLRRGDGSLGWAEQAPFDAILVSAGGPRVPRALLDQLAVGGRLVMPVGRQGRLQELLRITRRTDDDYSEDSLGPVSFVPLVGEQGWQPEDDRQPQDVPESGGGKRRAASAPSVVSPARQATIPELVARAAEPFAQIDDAPLDGLLRRIGGRRLVLLGEASHGTAEFYRLRARITRELIARHGFSIVAVEADWPDAARIDRWVHGVGGREEPEDAFVRFPTWMWRNQEVLEFVDWLREHNRAASKSSRQASFYGLDLYSLYSSIGEVLRYLEGVDPDVAQLARRRYGCLTPFQSDPAQYGYAALSEMYRSCEEEVVKILRELRQRRGEYLSADGRQFLDAEQNARVAANAERYYRLMYHSGADSWNLRDEHMFETLEALLAFGGAGSKAVVWAHNSHLGDASATSMAARGELNLGQLVRERYGGDAYLVGFGTDHGTVAAASEWGGEMEVKRIRPAHADSYEAVCHDSAVAAFFLPLADGELHRRLSEPRLERAIGVIYRPESELLSHYFEARLPAQFDEWIWFDETTAVSPLGGPGVAVDLAPGHPFATVDR